MKRYVALAAVMTAIATSAAAQGVVAPAPMAAPMTSEGFRVMALQSDAFEIESSRLALERSRNPAVRAYARQMVQDHSMTTQALLPQGYAVGPSGTLVASNTATGAAGGALVGAAVAGPVGAAVGAAVGAGAGATAGAAAGRPVAAPVASRVPLSARHAAMLNQLAAARGATFDVLYGQMQVASHQEAVAMFAAFAQGGTDPAMRAFAQQVLPDLQHHLAMAQRLPGARAGRAR